MHKPYISLQDIYTKRMILNEGPENVDIYAKPGDGTGTQKLGTIDKTYYQVLRREIQSKQKGGLMDIIDDLIEMGGWVAKDPAYKEMIMMLALNAFVKTEVDVDIDKFRAFVERKKEGKLNFIDKHFKGGEIFNIAEVLEPKLKPFISDPQPLIKKLWKVDPQRGRVGIGPGEIVLSFFTGSGKGSTGDLWFETLGEVEMKSSPGRLGSDDTTKDAPEALRKILKRTADIELASGRDIQKTRDNISKSVDKAATMISTLTNIIKNSNHPEDVKANMLTYPDASLGDVSKFLDVVIATHYTVEDLDVIHTNIRVILNNISDGFTDKSVNRQINNPVKTQSGWGIMQWVDRIIEFKKDYTRLREKAISFKKGNLTWTIAVQSFFLNDWNLSKEDIVLGLTKLRTEPMELDVSDLAKGIDDVLTPSRLRALKHGDKKLLKQLAIAIQLTSYQSVHGFPYLLLANKQTLDAFCFIFPKGDVRKKFINIFDQVSKHSKSGRLDTNLDVDVANKGIQIVLK